MLRLFGMPGVGDRRDAARRRGADRGLRPSSRSRPACGAARSRWSAARAAGLRRGSSCVELMLERHADTLFSTDGSLVDEQVARLLAGALDRAGGVVHRRADVGAADRARRGRRSTSPAASSPTPTRPRRPAGRRHGADRGVGAVSPRSPRWPTGRWRASTPTPRSRSPASPGRAGGRRTSRSATSAGASARRRALMTRDIRLPGDRAEIRDRSTTVAMHLLRRVLSEGAAAEAPEAATAAQKQASAGRAPACSSRSTFPRTLGTCSSGGATATCSPHRRAAGAPGGTSRDVVFLGWHDGSAAERIADVAFGALPAGPPPLRLTATR